MKQSNIPQTVFLSTHSKSCRVCGSILFCEMDMSPQTCAEWIALLLKKVNGPMPMQFVMHANANVLLCKVYGQMMNDIALLQARFPEAVGMAYLDSPGDAK